MKLSKSLKDDSASVTHRIYEKIRMAILTGEIPAGERLVELDLAAKMNSSRTPVREALQKIASEGLIYSIPRAGYIVGEISETDLQEIFEMREALEGMASRLAARRREDDEVERIIELFERIEKHSADTELEYYVEIGEKLHQFILQSCNNSMIANTMERLRTRIMRIWKGGLSIPGRIDKAFEEHKEILMTIKEKNEDLAEHKMRQHISSAFKEYIKEMFLR